MHYIIAYIEFVLGLVAAYINFIAEHPFESVLALSFVYMFPDLIQYIYRMIKRSQATHLV